MQKLANILFIVIIVLIATVMPVNTDIVNINLSDPIVDHPATTNPIPMTSHVTLTPPSEGRLNYGKKPIDHIELTFVSSNGYFEPDFLSDYILTVQTYDHEEIKTIPLGLREPTYLEDQATILLSPEDILSECRPGFYQIQLQNKSIDEVYTWTATNLDFNFTLLPAMSVNPRKVTVTLFIPDEPYERLIPITKQISAPKNKWRDLFTLLQQGIPDTWGLRSAPTVVYSPNIRPRRGTIQMDFNARDLTAFQESMSEEALQIMFEAINRTYFHFEPFQSFLFQLGTHPFDADRYSKAPSIAAIYTPFKTNTGVMLLAPDFKIFDTLSSAQVNSSTFEKIVHHLAYSTSYPPEVQLEDVTFKSGVVSYTFTNTMQEILTDQKDYALLLHDCLLWSTFSIPNVKKVIINQIEYQKPENINFINTD